MSIVCGNSHLHWALHNDARGENLNPNLFWRTPHLTTADLEVPSTAEALSRHMPKYAHDVIFGCSENGTRAASVEASQKRPAAARLFSVYVISTNLDQLRYLTQLWSDIPCRMYQLEGDAFYSAEEGRYDGMGVDRLATLRGAGEQWGYPALVFDGGTATTYTAADADGRILGGGIGPGLALKAKSLAEDCDALPDIPPREFIERMNDALEKKNAPLPIFSGNTKEAMMVQIMSETAHACRNVIKNWLEVVGSRDDRESVQRARGRSGGGGRKNGANQKMQFAKGAAENTKRNVIVTGGDGDLISHLIQADYSGILEGRSPIVAQGFDVILSKYVIHYGIQAALMDRVRERWNVQDKERFLKGEDEGKADVNQIYVGKRVAKWFKDVDAKGSHYFKGTITKVFRGIVGKGDDTVLFHIEFDDGDEEDAEIEELDELLKTYRKIEQDAEEEKIEKMNSKKATPPKDKSTAKAQNGSKKKKRDVDADLDDFSDSSSDGEAGQDSPKPKMPVPKTKPKKKAREAPKQAKKEQKKPKVDYIGNPGQFVKQRVAKDFGDGIYYGTITGFDEPEEDGGKVVYWKIKYDDGDQEEFEKKELKDALRIYDACKHNDPKRPSPEGDDDAKEDSKDDASMESGEDEAEFE